MTEIAVTDRSAQDTAVVRERVPVDELPQFFGRALHQAMTFLQAQGHHPVGPPIALYHGMPDGSVDVEAGFPVEAPITPGEGVTPGRLPGGRIVEAVHVGPYDAMEATYGEVMAWMSERRLTPAEEMWEVYLTDPDARPDPATWETRICWPVT
jgi:effector-binding domain-containing protein